MLYREFSFFFNIGFIFDNFNLLFLFQNYIKLMSNFLKIWLNYTPNTLFQNESPDIKFFMKKYFIIKSFSILNEQPLLKKTRVTNQSYSQTLSKNLFFSIDKWFCSVLAIFVIVFSSLILFNIEHNIDGYVDTCIHNIYILYKRI